MTPLSGISNTSRYVRSPFVWEFLPFSRYWWKEMAGFVDLLANSLLAKGEMAMPWQFALGAPLFAGALVWLWCNQEGAHPWERPVIGATALGLAVAVGVWLR
jgi:hypothetical protein